MCVCCVVGVDSGGWVGVCVCVCVCCVVGVDSGGLVLKSNLTLCNPMVCSPLGFSVRGISQARVLE